MTKLLIKTPREDIEFILNDEQAEIVRNAFLKFLINSNEKFIFSLKSGYEWIITKEFAKQCMFSFRQL